MQIKIQTSTSAAAPKPSKDYTELSGQIRAGIQMTATDIDAAINKAIDVQQKIVTKAQGEIEKLRDKAKALKVQLAKRGEKVRGANFNPAAGVSASLDKKSVDAIKALLFSGTAYARKSTGSQAGVPQTQYEFSEAKPGTLGNGLKVLLTIKAGRAELLALRHKSSPRAGGGSSHESKPIKLTYVQHRKIQEILKAVGINLPSQRA